MSESHDWKAEARGLAYMIQRIHADYMQAKGLGGDSEFLANSITQANSYVVGPLLERVTEQS